MSIDFDIAPARAELPTWGELLDRWRAELGDRAGALLGDGATLQRTGSDAALAPGARLEVGGYHFTLAVPQTIGLSLERNGDVDIDEMAVLEDYGRNLSAGEVEEIARSWANVGHTLQVTTLGGRSAEEPELLLALLGALTELTAGRVILMNDRVLDLGVGVYTAEQVRRSRWLTPGGGGGPATS